MTSSRISSGIESMTSGSGIERSTSNGARANRTSRVHVPPLDEHRAHQLRIGSRSLRQDYAEVLIPSLVRPGLSFQAGVWPGGGEDARFGWQRSACRLQCYRRGTVGGG